jgi:hypothetical protein
MWPVFFDKKRKRHIIPMPFKIVDISVKISASMVEMVGLFDSFNMKEVKSLKGFDPKGVFISHMVSIN